MTPIITPKQEEMLSYLTGLAPVGTPFQVRHKWIDQDFDRMDHSLFCQTVRRLIKAGCVERVATGCACDPSWYRVLVRPEHCAVVAPLQVQHLVREQRRAA